MQKIKIPNQEGKNISANLYTPTEPTEKLAILCPGYLHSKDYSHLTTLAEGLMGKGYTVVSFDPMGTWESDGELSSYTVSQYLLDIRSVFDYMMSRGQYSYVLLGGHSRGGGVSILFAADEPKISQVLCIMPSPQSPLPDERYSRWKDKGFEGSFQTVPGSFDKKEFLVPFSYVEDRAKYNVAKAAAKLKTPILLISGEVDDQVTFRDIENIFEVAMGPKKLIKIPGVGHTYWGESTLLKKVNETILESL